MRWFGWMAGEIIATVAGGALWPMISKEDGVEEQPDVLEEKGTLKIPVEG